MKNQTWINGNTLVKIERNGSFYQITIYEMTLPDNFNELRSILTFPMDEVHTIVFTSELEDQHYNRI